MKISVTCLFLGLMMSACGPANEGRETILLDEGWEFTREDSPDFANPEFEPESWQTVTVPHDWAIAGPFDMNIDAQKVKVTEDGDKYKKIRTGRTGALPFIGTGWYRYDLKRLSTDSGERYRIEFDGAMSNAMVYVNGKLAAERPYGYSSFAVDITEYLRKNARNILAVRLENKGESSRWYPGAGIYRNVRLVKLQPINIGHWGTFITTPEIRDDNASVNIKTMIENSGYTGNAVLRTMIVDKNGNRMASAESDILPGSNVSIEQEMKVTGIERWDIDNPVMYTAISRIIADGKTVDEYHTDFGIRTFAFDSDEGFSLNGKKVPLQGVCLHHDLGPLGAAVNTRAIERQLEILKEMGCNAVRTSHNPPAPELLELCDRMGFLVMDEAFDEWRIAKNKNGYAKLFDKWAETDLRDMIRRDRNHPSVIIWSIGNEIKEQLYPEGAATARFLTEICHMEDPTRPVSAGLNKYADALKNGFGDILDIVGFNYKPFAYGQVHEQYPGYCLFGSETASTVSSRGKYYLPVIESSNPFHTDFQCSSYDVEYPGWASTPDSEFAGQDNNAFVAGEFVWTGFDYLGEPTPYNETMSSRSSYFGIVDLAGLKKDRFYLYQSRWSDKKVLHLLPHWNWEKGDTVPVHCYTNYEEVELFLNGKSMGRRTFNQQHRYRLVWDGIAFEPGELKAVAYDKDGNIVEETSVHTAGIPYKLELEADRREISADGKDLSFIGISVVDKDGNLCPNAEIPLEFEVSGNSFLVLCNGDPTSLESFYGKRMPTFSGKCLAIVGKSRIKGNIGLKVKSTCLPDAEIEITTL